MFIYTHQISRPPISHQSIDRPLPRSQAPRCVTVGPLFVCLVCFVVKRLSKRRKDLRSLPPSRPRILLVTAVLFPNRLSIVPPESTIVVRGKPGFFFNDGSGVLFY